MWRLSNVIHTHSRPRRRGKPITKETWLLEIEKQLGRELEAEDLVPEATKPLVRSRQVREEELMALI